MKKQYESPVMEIVEFEAEDIITTSSEINNGLIIDPTGKNQSYKNIRN